MAACLWFFFQELVRLLQQTLRTSQGDWQGLHRAPQTSTAVPPSDTNSTPLAEQTEPPTVSPEALAQLQRLLQDRDAQIQSLCAHMERLALEKDSLQQELRGLKLKVGEMNEQLGMLMETIQAKDEVIMKLSEQQSAEPGQSEPSSPSLIKDQNEVDVLKVYSSLFIFLFL